MDTELLKIYELYKPEFKIYEGLILSHPLYKVVSILNKQYLLSNINYQKNTFNLNLDFDVNLNYSIIQLNKLITLTNNLGWYPASISSKNNESFINKIFDINNFKEFIIKEFLNINFSFEAKYDILEENYPNILYHVCETKHLNKILKYGLIPKSRSKKSFHPDRVYLVKNLDNAYKLAEIFNKMSLNKEWVILEINIETIRDYLKLFRDPNYLENGVYTLNNITPYCISLNNVLTFK